MQIYRFAIALLLLLVTASAAEVTASKKATRKAQKNNGGNATPYVYLWFILLFRSSQFILSISFNCDSYYSVEFTSFQFFCFSFSLFLYLHSIANGDDFDALLRNFHSMMDHAIALAGYEYACSHPMLDGNYDTACSIMKALGNPHPDEFVGIFRHLFWENETIGGRRLRSAGSWFSCAAMSVSTGLTCGNVFVQIFCTKDTCDYCLEMIQILEDNCYCEGANCV